MNMGMNMNMNINILWFIFCLYWFQVYLATAEFGLNSVEASGGYLNMANIFFHQNKMDAANSLYTEVGRTKNHPLSFSQLFLVPFPKFFPFPFNGMVTYQVSVLPFRINPRNSFHT